MRTTSLAETSGSDATGQVRYRLHDLIRIFARERAETEETSRARRSTVRRAIQARVAAAEHLAVHFDENGFGLIHGDPPCAPPRRTPLDPPGVDPTAWLEAELGALVAAVEQAAREGMPDLAWHLAGSLVDFFELRGHLTDWQRTHTAALQATTMAGDTVGTAVILQGLAFLEMARDHYEPALAHLDRAAELFGSADVLVGEVNCAAGAAVCHRLVGRLDQAAACAHQADALAEEAGYLLGQAHARYELGVVLREQGDLAGAADCLEQALAVARKGRYPRAEGIVLRGLGILYARRGDGERSIKHYEQARAVLTAIGDELRAAYATHQLADAHLDGGHAERAAPLLRRCIDVFQAQEDQFGTALALCTEAKLHRQTGHPGPAANGLEAAAQMWHRLGMPLWEARTLRDLGDLYAEIGATSAAASSWQRALKLVDRLHLPEAGEVSARLASASS